MSLIFSFCYCSFLHALLKQLWNLVLRFDRSLWNRVVLEVLVPFGPLCFCTLVFTTGSWSGSSHITQACCVCQFFHLEWSLRKRKAATQLSKSWARIQESGTLPLWNWNLCVMSIKQQVQDKQVWQNDKEEIHLAFKTQKYLIKQEERMCKCCLKKSWQPS